MSLAAALVLVLAQSLPGDLPEGVAAMRGEVARRTVNENAPPSRLDSCLALAGSDAAAAERSATGWLREERGSHQALPQLCLGTAYSTAQNWTAAEGAFVSGRDLAADSDHLLRARLGAMAGNAALAAGTPAVALALLDLARSDALAAGTATLSGAIAIDRARALVAMKRDSDAAAALSEARADSPDNAEAWLLSATLARREGKLAEAQQQIEMAAHLAPTDPAIGLEAGVIAILAGRRDAAAASWRSAIAAAPASPEAAAARGYLDEIGAAAAPEKR
ncbi:MAG: hypothetical protein KGK11_02635 [Sphingomonadales bacterium]|nr:hypothetical protein [Sphingomonadales bacterium]